MFREAGLGHGRQHRHPILPAFAGADRDLLSHEVDVLDAQPAALQESKAGAVEEQYRQAWNAVQALQDRPDFVPRENRRQVLRALCAHEVVEPRERDTQKKM
jgi:hypothetical protein